MPIALSGTNGITFPTWTTATRPASPATGQTGFNTTTGQLESYDGTQWGIYTAASSQGTAGRPLISSGSGVAPTFTTLGISAITATGTPSASTFLRGDGAWAGVSASGQLIRAPQILTSGTSYTTPSNCTAIYVECVGGGGSGANTTTAKSASGGGGAAYCAKYFTVTGSTAYSYAIGSGGAALGFTDANGNNGGNTTFTVGATTITAGGGTGGQRSASATDTYVLGGAGGTATNGDLNISGSSGGMSLARQTTTSILISGAGGGSVFSPVQPFLFNTQGTGAITAGVSGYSAASYGGGGGGGTQAGTNVASSGAGGNGMIRIWEFT